MLSKRKSKGGELIKDIQNNIGKCKRATLEVTKYMYMYKIHDAVLW